jgi:hypothetical protein
LAVKRYILLQVKKEYKKKKPSPCCENLSSPLFCKKYPHTFQSKTTVMSLKAFKRHKKKTENGKKMEKKEL